MDCEYAQKLISLYLAGDLPGDDLALLVQHVSTCEKCRGAFEEAKRYESALKGMLKQSISKLRSPKSRVLRRIESEPGPRRRGKRLLNWFLFILLVAVLCFLIVVAYISYEKVKQENLEKSQKAGAQLELLMQALRVYRADYGTFPVGSNPEMVGALQGTRKGRDMPYFAFSSEDLSDGLLVDPWSRPYIYRSTGETALLYSTGPDGRDDGGLGDDLRP